MKLLPQPQKILPGEGFFRLTRTHRITLDGTCPPCAYAYATLLSREITENTGIPVQVDRRTANAHPGILMKVAPGDRAESYTLDVTSDGVTLTAADQSGLLYGVQTLRQMLRQAGAMLPCLHMEDYPTLPNRGLFYDVTRCRIPTLEFLKALADKCAFYKMNQLHLYIEHTYLFDGLSEVWRDDSPLTSQDILELDAYCRKLNIDLVPSIATLGHLYKVLRTKTYRHLSEFEEADGTPFSLRRRMGHHTLDVTQSESLELVYRMIDEYAALFTSKKFNINGDEPFDLGRGRGKAQADRVGSHRMYVDWLKKICRHVEELGKTPMFWSDVIVAEPEMIHELPADSICMNWNYNPEAWDVETRKLAEVGANQYLCPGAQGWKQTVNLFPEAYSNIRRMANNAYRFGAQGFLVTEWGDYGHLQDPESSLPGILYAAALAWNGAETTEEALNQAVSVVEYGDPTGKVMEVLAKLSHQLVADWGKLVEIAEISQGHVPEQTMEEFRQRNWASMSGKAARVEEFNRTIDRCQEELCRLMPAMEGRKRMYPYLLMSDGQKLFNRFAALWVASDGEPRDKALAEELECWYQDFKTRWHVTSRESELYRNGEVLFWMADNLRK